eukprot:CAMPEP_0177637988 /NCGR_PEP_ID=MMETSP0447-20121125/5255_1 /TAXON_ID=0 /ORGANISM="Stygamoeba regulata, Strain BSH-02190019" /LENGTH=64 /DNA_ID=CAMNT_0019139933 /DNA_START=87 /DNA_END=281 /DNA_ORIENTATION=+
MPMVKGGGISHVRTDAAVVANGWAQRFTSRPVHAGSSASVTGSGTQPPPSNQQKQPQRNGPPHG